MPRSSKLKQGKNGKLASAKSKTGSAACSQAASLFARGMATADTYKMLGECRSKARIAGQAKLQREAGNEGKAQVLEKRAERGLTVAARVAKAKELIAARKAAKSAPAVQAKPSLREQAATARASKGTREDRMASLRERASARMSVLTDKSPDTGLADRLRASGTKSGVAKANKIDAEYKVASKNMDVVRGRLKKLGHKSAMAQQAEAKPSTLQQAAAARTAKGDRTTRLKALADKSMSLAESRATKAGSLAGAAQDRMIDRSMSAADRYNRLEAARTPYKPSAGAAVPAIKSGLPTTKGGLPAETPKLSLLEQARIRRAAKNADGNRDGRLAARAKKQYDAARRNMKANLEKAKTLGPGQGDKYVAKATKYGKRLDVASERYVNLYNSWATGGKFTTARVIK